MARMKIIDGRDELIRKLGTVPDNILAKEYHLSRERIRQLRKERGIPVFSSPRPRHVPRAIRKGASRRKTEYFETYKSELSALKKFELSRKE